jgi:Tol biopolymer transport system component
VFVRDRVAQVTRRVSVGPGGQQANGGSRKPAISADGRFVAFESSASNLVAGDTNGHIDVFVRDRVAQVTRRVSVGPGGQQANGSSRDPAISADGRFVAFRSLASNLVAGDPNDS